VVSVLEGGYNINGGVVSAFARSVEAHVRGLAEQHSQVSMERSYVSLLGQACRVPACCCAQQQVLMRSIAGVKALHHSPNFCVLARSSAPMQQLVNSPNQPR
jgi:hypothetical protein